VKVKIWCGNCKKWKIAEQMVNNYMFVMECDHKIVYIKVEEED